MTRASVSLARTQVNSSLRLLIRGTFRFLQFYFDLINQIIIGMTRLSFSFRSDPFTYFFCYLINSKWDGQTFPEGHIDLFQCMSCYANVVVIPDICYGSHGYTRVKKFLAGVNFYRFNAKNWHLRQMLRKKVAFFLQI